jgi:cytoskeleton protein RodZ
VLQGHKSSVEEKNLELSPSPVSVANDPSLLSLNAKSEVWVSVIDGSGKKLIYRTLSSGEKVTVSGMFPYKILLGKADGADVYLGDRSIDTTPYIRGTMARFVLGKENIPG